jgi:hypothetical protein
MITISNNYTARMPKIRQPAVAACCLGASPQAPERHPVRRAHTPPSGNSGHYLKTIFHNIATSSPTAPLDLVSEA